MPQINRSPLLISRLHNPDRLPFGCSTCPVPVVGCCRSSSNKSANQSILLIMKFTGGGYIRRGLSKRESSSYVPGPGIEPGWIAPTVFETVASTDSAIRAGRWCKGTHNILNRNTAMQHWMRSVITNRAEWMLNRMKVHIFALFLSSQDTVFFFCIFL